MSRRFSYYLGSRAGISKKSGNWFGCTTVLFTDQYGNPITDTIFWESKEDFMESDVDIAQDSFNGGFASPIVIRRSADGKRLASLTVHDTVPDLDVRPLLGIFEESGSDSEDK